MLSSVLISSNKGEDFHAQLEGELRWMSQNNIKLIDVKFSTSPVMRDRVPIEHITQFSALILLEKPDAAK